MKKLSIFLTFLIVLGAMGGSVFAEQPDLPSAGLTPNNFLYFLDTVWERIVIFFSFSEEAKIKNAIKFADEKMAEIKLLSRQENKTKHLEKINNKYNEYLDLADQKLNQAKQKGKNIEDLSSLIAERTSYHQQVLQQVLERAPEQARKGLETAIESSSKGMQNAIKHLPEKERERYQQKSQQKNQEGQQNQQQEQNQQQNREGQEAQATMSSFLESIVDKNYEKAASYLITSKGEDFSQEAKQEFIGELKESPIVDYSVTGSELYETEELEQAIGISNTAFDEAQLVYFSITPQGASSPENAFFPLVYHSGEWRLLLPK